MEPRRGPGVQQSAGPGAATRALRLRRDALSFSHPAPFRLRMCASAARNLTSFRSANQHAEAVFPIDPYGDLPAGLGVFRISKPNITE
ncbi:MAG TPA: hypothetical protein VLK84_27005 [Longimicrobium sp.]|nr:hypothetical protein [Longimicrobium sp.]